jgi:membrane protease YdiL (CAAX protease family)
MVTTVLTAARIAGLFAALAALMRETWLLRAPGTLPIARLVQREFRPKLGLGQLTLCIIAGVLLVAAPIGWSITLGHVELVRDPQWRLASILALVATVIVKVLWVLFEELAFRAAMIRVLARRTGIALAVAFSAAAFAAAHGRDAMSAAVLIVDGIGFGVAYVATGGIRAPIVWHLSKNLVVWLLTGQSTLQFATLPWRLVGESPTAWVELSFAVVIVGVTSAVLMRSTSISTGVRSQFHPFVASANRSSARERSIDSTTK